MQPSFKFLDTNGAGNDYFTARWTFALAGRPITIAPGMLFAFDLNDDLSGLVSFTANLQGFHQ